MIKSTCSKFIALFFLLHLANISFAQDISEKDAHNLVVANGHLLPMTPIDIQNGAVNSAYIDKTTNLQYVYFQQTAKGIKVFNKVVTLIFKNGQLQYYSGKFISNIDAKAIASTPIISASDAVARTANHLNLSQPTSLSTVQDKMATDNKMIFTDGGIAKSNIETELFWVSTDDGATLHLAWNTNIDVLHSSDWWNVRVDAITGEVINKNNWTIYEQNCNVLNQHNSFENKISTSIAKDGLKSAMAPATVTSASYRVVPFPNESPNVGGLSIVTNPWLLAGTTNNATTDGWHYDGTTNYTITRGNNVFAYLDVSNLNASNATNNWPDTSSTSNPTLTFTTAPNFTIDPSNTINKQFAIQNLFYWNNLMHDVSYQYGFTEAAGNFQDDVLGRGGSGNDHVLAEGQDGGGSNNANFASPADGSSGRMQMFIFNAVPGVIVNSPASVAGNYTSVEGAMSTANLIANVGSKTGNLSLYNDVASGPTIASNACTSAPVNSIAGKIALIYRGTCAFTVKVKLAQTAGAIAVIMINNIAGAPIIMGGTDNTITIPAVMISDVDGATLANQLTLGNSVNVTISAGVKLDGDIDDGVVSHEYTHGISNRLTGGRTNANCLTNAEQGGEGWSDYVACMMTTNWSTALLTDGSKAHPMGTYVEGQALTGPGIRTYPYSTDMTIDPHTYADVANTTYAGEVHYIGEIWCTVLWDMTWNIIQQESYIDPNLYNAGGAGGNTKALKLVIEGMRLQPCYPGFLDARDAILAADSILYNGAHKCSIWNAFARRGMGFSAVQGSSNSTTDQTAAYDVPTGVRLTKAATPSFVASGQQVTLNYTASCQCTVPQNSLTIQDTIPTGFSYVSSSEGTVTSGILNIPAFNLTTPLQTKSFSVVLKATAANCTVDTVINDNRDALTVGGLTSSAITGTTNWASTTTRYNSPTHSWYATDPASTTNFALTSAAFTANPLSVLSFWHYYITENYIDGGVVEVSTDGGTTWNSLSPSFLQNSYNTTMNASSGLGSGTRAFSGVSDDKFVKTVVDLSSYSGQSIKVRFRMQTNASNTGGTAYASTYEGWYVDDILAVRGCGGINKVALFNSGSRKLDSSYTPVFITSQVAVPLNLLGFSAKQIAQQVLLKWSTTEEVNTKEFELERSTDGNNWYSIGTTTATNTSAQHDYVYYDAKPSNGINYYRLKMVDNDGKYVYSPIRTVEFGKNGIQLTVVPNPATSYTNVYFDPTIKTGMISVFDAQGRTIISESFSNANGTYHLQTANIASGVYVVNVKSNDGGSYTARLIVSK